MFKYNLLPVYYETVLLENEFKRGTIVYSRNPEINNANEFGELKSETKTVTP